MESKRQIKSLADYAQSHALALDEVLSASDDDLSVWIETVCEDDEFQQQLLLRESQIRKELEANDLPPDRCSTLADLMEETSLSRQELLELPLRDFKKLSFDILHCGLLGWHFLIEERKVGRRAAMMRSPSPMTQPIPMRAPSPIFTNRVPSPIPRQTKPFSSQQPKSKYFVGRKKRYESSLDEDSEVEYTPASWKRTAVAVKKRFTTNTARKKRSPLMKAPPRSQRHRDIRERFEESEDDRKDYRMSDGNKSSDEGRHKRNNRGACEARDEESSDDDEIVESYNPRVPAELEEFEVYSEKEDEPAEEEGSSTAEAKPSKETSVVGVGPLRVTWAKQSAANKPKPGVRRRAIGSMKRRSPSTATTTTSPEDMVVWEKIAFVCGFM